MSLTIEWAHRIDNWRRELPNHFYRELAQVEFGGFVTLEQLTLAEAGKRSYLPMPPGTPWGAKWEYGWFKGELVCLGLRWVGGSFSRLTWARRAPSG